MKFINRNQHERLELIQIIIRNFLKKQGFFVPILIFEKYWPIF